MYGLGQVFWLFRLGPHSLFRFQWVIQLLIFVCWVMWVGEWWLLRCWSRTLFNRSGDPVIPFPVITNIYEFSSVKLAVKMAMYVNTQLQSCDWQCWPLHLWLWQCETGSQNGTGCLETTTVMQQCWPLQSWLCLCETDSQRDAVCLETPQSCDKVDHYRRLWLQQCETGSHNGYVCWETTTVMRQCWPLHSWIWQCEAGSRNGTVWLYIWRQLRSCDNVDHCRLPWLGQCGAGN